MFEAQKRDIIKAALKLDRYGLIALSGGNLSSRMPTGEILVTPSGMIYEDMAEDDMLVMDVEGNIIEGDKKPSVDTQALLYIFKHMPHINAVIHTHQPYATAISLVADELPVAVTTLANATRGAVKVCPFTSAASLEMGKQAVENLNGTLAVILKQHGVISVGETLSQALYACVYLEEAAKTYSIASAMGTPSLLTSAQVRQAVQVFDYYGQGSDDMPDEVVN